MGIESLGMRLDNILRFWNFYGSATILENTIYTAGSDTVVTIWNSEEGHVRIEVIGEDSFGCFSNTAISQVNVSDVTALKNVATTIFEIFPNPANDEIEIILTIPLVDIKIKIVNSLGQIILEEKKKNSNKFTLDVSNYPNGIYYVEVESKQEISRAKFVKN